MHKREHDGVVAAEQQTFVLQAFAACARPYCGSPARFVLDGDDKFETDEIGVGESPLSQVPNGGRRDAAPGCGRANPVAQVGSGSSHST